MNPRIRVLTFVTVAAVVIATTVGCGLLSAAKKIANNASTLEDLSSKLVNGQKLTFQAVYTETGGAKTTIVNAPPKAAFISDSGSWIFDGSYIYACDTTATPVSCTKTQQTDTGDIDSLYAASGLAGSGFFAGELGIGLLAAAMIVPNVKVSKSTKKIAGLNSQCIAVTDLGDASSSTDLVSFSMCIADNGIVTSYTGTDSDGKTTGETMTSFSTSVDQSMFAPPAGATVTDGSTLPGASMPPSAPPSALPSDDPSAVPSGAPSPDPSAS